MWFQSRMSWNRKFLNVFLIQVRKNTVKINGKSYTKFRPPWSVTFIVIVYRRAPGNFAPWLLTGLLSELAGKLTVLPKSPVFIYSKSQFAYFKISAGSQKEVNFRFWFSIESYPKMQNFRSIGALKLFLFNTYSMKQPDLYYFETIKMTW